MTNNCCYLMGYFRCWKEVRNIISFQYVVQSASAIDISKPKQLFPSIESTENVLSVCLISLLKAKVLFFYIKGKKNTRV